MTNIKLVLAVALIALLGACQTPPPATEADPADSSSLEPPAEPLDPTLSATALYQLGVMHFEGTDGVKNELEAVKQWRAAADLGFAPAQAAVGWAYANGRGIGRDYRKSRDYYMAAAKQDYIPALVELAHLYFSGANPAIRRNEQEAAQMFRRAAERGNGYAKYMIGWMLRAGRGVAQDYAAAAKFLGEAAELGMPEAMSELGVLYANGLGVTQDQDRAFQLFLKAAEAGNRIAMYNVAINYRDGLGTPRDGRAAVRWFEASALKGHQGAALQVGRMYEQGTGIDKDPAKAAAWFRVAAGLKSIDDAPVTPGIK